MKKIAFFVIISFINTPLFCGKNSLELAPTCKRVKDLDPWGTKEEYIELAQEMKRQKLSLCSCIQQITEYKMNRSIEKAFPELESDFPNKFLKKNLIFKDIRCEPNVPNYICNLTKEIFTESKDEFEEEESEYPLNVHIQRIHSTQIEYPDYQNSDNKYYSLLVNPKEIRTPEVLRHEKTHADFDLKLKTHPLLYQVLKAKLEKEMRKISTQITPLQVAFLSKLPQGMVDRMVDRLVKEINESFEKAHILKASELQADLIPAACIQDSCPKDLALHFYNDAYPKLHNLAVTEKIDLNAFYNLSACLTYFENPHSKSICKLLLDRYKPDFDSFDDTHPNVFKRIAWLTKVDKLHNASKEVDRELLTQKVTEYLKSPIKTHQLYSLKEMEHATLDKKILDEVHDVENYHN